MRGYPKNLNTKQDYLFVMDNFPREKWEKDIQDLLATESDWFFAHILASSDPGINDETHKVVEESDFAGHKVRAQYEWKANPQAKLVRLGFTRSELEAALAQ